MSIQTSLPLAAVVSFLWLAAGCGDPSHGPPSGGGHRHASVHGGVAVELGEHQFHLDVLADPAAGELKAWVMDAHVESFVRVPLASIEVAVTAGDRVRTVSLAAQANPATGETVGNTSYFVGRADWLKGLERFTGSVARIEIRGATFREVGFSYPGDGWGGAGGSGRPQLPATAGGTGWYWVCVWRSLI